MLCCLKTETVPNVVFARNDYSGPALTNLIDIINYVKPTALFGLSTVNVNSKHTLDCWFITTHRR